MDQLALPLGDVRNDAAASFPAPPPSSRSAGATPAAATTRVLRLGELIGSLSHALDLAAGQPLGHAVRSCWIGQQIGATLGLGATQMRELYYASLLKDAGDSSNAPYICRTFAACDLRFKQDRRIADQNPTGLPRFVAGSIGPSGMLPSTNDPTLSNITFEELVDVFREQSVGLIQGGAPNGAVRDGDWKLIEWYEDRATE